MSILIARVQSIDENYYAPAVAYVIARYTPTGDIYKVLQDGLNNNSILPEDLIHELDIINTRANNFIQFVLGYCESLMVKIKENGQPIEGKITLLSKYIKCLVENVELAIVDFNNIIVTLENKGLNNEEQNIPQRLIALYNTLKGTNDQIKALVNKYALNLELKDENTQENIVQNNNKNDNNDNQRCCRIF